MHIIINHIHHHSGTGAGRRCKRPAPIATPHTHTFRAARPGWLRPARRPAGLRLKPAQTSIDRRFSIAARVRTYSWSVSVRGPERGSGSSRLSPPQAHRHPTHTPRASARRGLPEARRIPPYPGLSLAGSEPSPAFRAVSHRQPSSCGLPAAAVFRRTPVCLRNSQAASHHQLSGQ